MPFTRDELIDWVQSRIDEVAPLPESVALSPVKIGQELDEAASFVLRSVPKQFVYPVAEPYIVGPFLRLVDDKPYSLVFPLPPLFSTLNGATTVLTGQFLRFIRMQLTFWQRPADDLMGVDSTEYRQRLNRWSRSVALNPTAALIPFVFTAAPSPTLSVSFRQAIEAFPPPDDMAEYQLDTTTTGYDNGSATGLKLYKVTDLAAGKKNILGEFLIVRYMAAENVPPALIDPVVWYAASNCLTSLRQSAEAQKALEKYAIATKGIRIGMKGEDIPVLPQAK